MTEEPKQASIGAAVSYRLYGEWKVYCVYSTLFADGTFIVQAATSAKMMQRLHITQYMGNTNTLV